MSGKYLDYDGLSYLWSKIGAQTRSQDPSFWDLDTTASSGRDYELWQALQEIGWDSEVIVND